MQVLRVTGCSQLRQSYHLLCSLRAASHASSDNPTAPVTLKTLFSDSNMERCKDELLSVDPARSAPWAQMDKMRQAAVLVPLCIVDGEPAILFTVRSLELTSHRGEVSFPGGMVDQTDTHRVQTAIREAEEEIGVDPRDVDIWGALQRVPGKNLATAVTPVLGFCHDVDVAKLRINEQEVSEVFTCTIESLCRPENTRYTKFRGKFNYTLPAFLGGQHRIWGLTAVILHQTLTLIAPGVYNFDFKFR